VIKPHLGQVDHDAAARRHRQDVPRRQRDLYAFARHPGVDPPVCHLDFVVAKPSTTGDVEQRVLVTRCHHLHLTDQIDVRWRHGSRFSRSADRCGGEQRHQGAQAGAGGNHAWVLSIGQRKSRGV
jgi:hypothetical protein